MASLRTRTRGAAALHRQAAATLAAAASALAAPGSPPADPGQQPDQPLEQLRRAAAILAPGWLGAPLETRPPGEPVGGPRQSGFVRVGVARPDGDGAGFPVVLPLLGAGHLALDRDARNPRVAGLLRAVLLRLLAAAPPGCVLVRAVDCTGAAVFGPFAPLAEPGLFPPPATDVAGLRGALTEAERRIARGRSTRPRAGADDNFLLLVVAALPDPAEPDVVRLSRLAEQGPEHGVHLVVAGWPSGQPPLPRSTSVAVRDAQALVGDPPGGFFGTPGAGSASFGLNAPVLLDADPPAQLVAAVCGGLRSRAGSPERPLLTALLPDADAPLWADDATAGLVVPIGYAGDRTVTLQLNELTPHWLVGGRAGVGKSAFLTSVLYGLSTRYGPDELALYLISFASGGAFAEFAASEPDGTWLPQARAIGVAADREYGVAVLRELAAELARRAAMAEAAGAGRFAELRGQHPLPRIVCAVDAFPALLVDCDPVAVEAAELLESLARGGRSYGIHLVLAGRTGQLPARYAERDPIFGQFPVRVALPGGDDVLDPANDAAAGLPVGTAVVNTAGGLGGPRGATRGHERVVRCPDPYADAPALARVRQRIWAARPPDAPAPRVYAARGHDQHVGLGRAQ